MSRLYLQLCCVWLGVLCEIIIRGKSSRVQEMFSNQEITVTYWGHNWLLEHTHINSCIGRVCGDCVMLELFIVTVIKWEGQACVHGLLTDCEGFWNAYTQWTHGSWGHFTARCWFYVYYNVHRVVFTSTLSLTATCACCALE